MDVVIEHFGEQDNLLINGIVVSNEADLRAFKVLYANVRGNVLMGGLGMGLGAKWLCSLSQIESVTVIELVPEVIELFSQNTRRIENASVQTKPSDSSCNGAVAKLTIIQGDFYETNVSGFDFVIDDCLLGG